MIERFQYKNRINHKHIIQRLKKVTVIRENFRYPTFILVCRKSITFPIITPESRGEEPDESICVVEHV